MLAQVLFLTFVIKWYCECNLIGHKDILMRFLSIFKASKCLVRADLKGEELKWYKPEALRWMTLKMKAHDGDVSLAKKFSH